MPAYTKPLPHVDDLNRPHWEGAARGEFLVQQCSACKHRWFPPLPNCPACLAAGYTWSKVSGRGVVHSLIVYHQGWLPGYKEAIPYNVAIIELEEGLRVINNIVDVQGEQVPIGAKVHVVFENVAPGIVIPRFALTAA